MSTTDRRARGDRRPVRTAAACGAAALGLLALSACDKPTPVATVTVGSDTVHTHAACYRDGRPLDSRTLSACQRRRPTESITISPGDVLRLGVEPEIADPGWVMYVNGQPVSRPLDTTYRSLSADGFFPQNRQQRATPNAAELTIAEEDAKGTVYGLWRFRLNLDG